MVHQAHNYFACFFVALVTSLKISYNSEFLARFLGQHNQSFSL